MIIHHHPQSCRGTMLLQLILVVALTGILLNLSVLLINSIWKLENTTLDADRHSKSFQKLAMQIARDLESADEVNITRKFMLLDKHLLWRLGESKIIRKTDEKEQSFDVGDLELTFTPTNYGAILKAEDKQGHIARLPLVKTRKWSQKVVNP